MSKDVKIRTRKGKLGTEIYVTDIRDGGCTAYFLDFPQIITQGVTVSDAQKKLWNATYDILMSVVNKNENS